ncbi:hypothetical protein F3Y22_tig00111309pilonHSYRG00087 [Hibiscus syriacus]|uniref:Uncharacterized protein n=1 Tax=Hibiscus syriacus TaxID=106335 RepID=A0A6A2YQT7_HIBSY|nr:hypothetical protein F3Y22_tig00111309pilonHSYRG00087 [Hibiscus syriacus]
MSAFFCFTVFREWSTSVQKGDSVGQSIDADGSNLPSGGRNDSEFWIDLPSARPATLKVGVMNFALSRVGQHVCDWEHFTLRICNFTGELWSIYFSQHSGGLWVNAYDLGSRVSWRGCFRAWLVAVMRKWGPSIVYGSRTELDRIINSVPLMLRYSMANIFGKLPVELYGEEGPTGPKEKNNWEGDERG